MKISFRDRIQATKFSQIYRRDFERYAKRRDKDGDIDIKVGAPWDPRIHLSKAGKRLCRKWGLRFPVAPDAPLEPLAYTGGGTPSNLPAWMIDGAAYPVSFPSKDELKNPSRIGVADSAGYRVVTHIDGRLCLLIDTTFPPDMIMGALREFVGHYATETTDRQGNMLDDSWKVYEMYQGGKNLLDITVALHGVSRQPAYDPKSDAHYRAVRRAYAKAKAMIRFVEKEVSKR